MRVGIVRGGCEVEFWKGAGGVDRKTGVEPLAAGGQVTKRAPMVKADEA
jgi:hypothetical protein